MAYFDGLADGSFKKDANGNMLFYPWGVAGKGYVLESEAAYTRIRSFFKTYIKMMIPMLIAAAVVSQLYGGYLYIVVLTALLVPYLGWYIIAIRRMTSGLAYAGESLTFSESYSNSAKSYSLAILICLLVPSLMFTAGGLWMLYSGEYLMGLLGVAFFCGFAAFAAYMIKVKLKQK